MSTESHLRPTAETLLSIVIVSWNTREQLRACLRSVEIACQELAGPVQTIVVDNASADGSTEMLNREFSWVTCVAHATNLGFAAAANHGIRSSAGKYILLLNPDTEVEPGSVARLVGFMEAHPDAGGAGPRILGADGVLQDSCFPLPTVGRELWRLFHLDRLQRLASYPLHEWSSNGARRVETIQGACFLVRSDVLQDLGGLDERFYIYTEEVDLCRRMHDAGWSLFWVPQASIVHAGGQSTRQAAPRMFLELYRSKVQYFRKHTGIWGARVYKFVLVTAAIPRVIVPAILAVLRPGTRAELEPVIRNYSSLLRALSAL
jgi:N-acetylglucosaminyl-diphospho-decaprenol L-rhamnosyltransferase